METSSIEATHALLGAYKGGVGVIQWHDNELDAWREAKRINSDNGNVKVVPVVNGRLTEKYEEEKKALFEEHCNRLGIK